MSNTKAKKQMNKKNIITFLVILFACMYFFFTLIVQQFDISQNKKTLTAIQNDIREQQQAKKQLEEQKKLVNSKDYIEKLAREKLNLVRPDEIIFVDPSKAK